MDSPKILMDRLEPEKLDFWSNNQKQEFNWFQKDSSANIDVGLDVCGWGKIWSEGRRGGKAAESEMKGWDGFPGLFSAESQGNSSWQTFEGLQRAGLERN